MAKQRRSWKAAAAALLACGLLAAMLPAAAASVEAGAVEASQARLLELHRSIFEAAILRDDRAPLRQAALDALLIVPPGGIVEDLPQALSGTSNFAVDAVSVSDERVLLQGDTAVVIARLVLDGTFDGSVLPPMRTLTVFVRTDGDWRLLARSVTACSPRAIAAGRC